MPSDTINTHFDLALVSLYVFWVAFAGLIYYLVRESRREGFPLLNEVRGELVVRAPYTAPPEKSFLTAHHGRIVPHTPERDLTGLLSPQSLLPGAPLQPLGNPMADGVGPASYAMRADVPDMTFDDNTPKIVPLRTAPAYSIAEEDPNPVGFAVVTADGLQAGTVVDAWVDRSDMLIRYLEADAEGTTGMRRIVFPMFLATVNARERRVNVVSVLAHQFLEAPGLQNADTITLREEDRISGYFAGGHMYATPSRFGPVL